MTPPSSLPDMYLFSPLLPDYWCVCSADHIVRQATLSRDGSIPYYRSIADYRVRSGADLIHLPCIWCGFDLVGVAGGILGFLALHTYVVCWWNGWVKY